MRFIVVLYGLVNALAYCCLLPLWEGFDEGYHYGNVQWFSTQRRFPVAGQANLSREVWRAYELVPVSHYLQPYTKAPMNFTDYFALSAEEREKQRRELESIPSSDKYQQQSDKPNYEATQAPLPYVLMAVIDGALSGLPIPSRVLWLRIICAMAIVLILAHGMRLLAGDLQLEEPFATAALFCAFSSQMLLAVLCHVCNDAFAVPALIYLLWAAIRAFRSGRVRHWAIAGAITGAALLTKAYLLFVMPAPVALLVWAVWRRRAMLVSASAFAVAAMIVAGPWYARNLVLYRNLSGALETTTNLSFGALCRAALQLPWRESIVYMAHTSLWTGNNSFTTFSAATLDFMLALLGAGAILFILRSRRSAAEFAIAASVVLFSGGLAFIAVAFYVSSKGGAIGPMPWYAQVLVAPVMLIVFLGLSRAGRVGRAGLALFVVAWAYLMTATYLLKLVPLYGGFVGKTKLPAVWGWYLSSAARRDEILSHACMASAGLLWTLIVLTSLLAIFGAGRLLLRAAK